MKTKLMTLCLAALATVSLLALTACGSGSALTETASDISSFEEASSAESEVTSEVESNVIAEEPIGSAEQPIEEPINTTTNDTNAGGQTNQNNNTMHTPPSNGNVNTSDNSGGNTNVGSSNTNTGTATKPQQQQQMVAPVQTQPTVHQPIYKQQWVVDQAAWSEEVPVWGNKGIMVCNTCGADISGHAGEHLDETMHGGYHSENIKIQTGTRTIHHEEQGHYESVLVCGGCTGTH